MKAAVIFGVPAYAGDASLGRMFDRLRAGGFSIEEVTKEGPLPGDCAVLLSVGGDGTFLAASALAAPASVPVVGVNLGRMGFLSENEPSDVADALLAGDYIVEDRTLLDARLKDGAAERHFTALNDIVVSREGSAMLGTEVSIDGMALPAYWGDGLLVATASGSTAYSLSVGGPIVLPSSKVLIIAPVAPHNLNVRPLIVPEDSEISISFRSRSPRVRLSADNTACCASSDSILSVRVAQFSLKRIRLRKASFIKALSDKLHWGDDIRNEKYD